MPSGESWAKNPPSSIEREWATAASWSSPESDERPQAVRDTGRVEAGQDLAVERLQALRAPPERRRRRLPGRRAGRRGRAAVQGRGSCAFHLLRASASLADSRLPRTGEAGAPRHRRGRLRDGVESRPMTLTVLNPATEQPIAELEQAGVEETDAAVARAKAAFPAWRAVAPADRARLLRRLATLVEEHHEALSRLESANAGKPIAGARGEIGMVAQVLPLLRRRRRQALRRDDPGRRRHRRHLPRAARRRRADHALELPAQHRELEDRPRARDRQHDRDQAGRADAADDGPARRARARGGHPRGRPQRRRRQGLGRRPAARRASGRGEDRLHGLDRGRASA